MMRMTHSRPGIRRSRSSIEGKLHIRAAMRDWVGPMIDASLSGLRAECPSKFALPLGQICELELDFGCGHMLRSRAQLVRLIDGEVAFRFDALSPNTEYELRQILESRGRLIDGARDGFDGAVEAR